MPARRPAAAGSRGGALLIAASVVVTSYCSVGAFSPSLSHNHVSWKSSRRRADRNHRPTCTCSLSLADAQDRSWRRGGAALSQSTNMDVDVDQQNDRPQHVIKEGSYIESIRSRNLAGMVSGDGSGEDISINLADEPNLVAVTGETGSGKSVLIAKVANLVVGGPASPTLLPAASEDDADTAAEVEMTIQLAEPHLSTVQMACQRNGLDPNLLVLSSTETGKATSKLVLKRTLTLAQQGKASTSKRRLKSTCQMNGQIVTLKAMKAVAGPLLTIVDAAAAAAALSRPNARLAVIDIAVPISIIADAHRAKSAYRKARQYREKLEMELNTQVLPMSYSHSDDPNEEAIEMLRHWVEELDAFEDRAMKFRDAALPQMTDDDSLFSGAPSRFQAAEWFDCTDETGTTSEFYTQLLDFRELVKDMDGQLQAAISARDALSALSLPDSAITALERARNHLYDATGGRANSGDDDGKWDEYSVAAEVAHERLNAVEDALSDCVKSLDDNKGLIATLERMTSIIGVSLEDIDMLIADWNTKARKHGISPFSLPNCHRSLRSELDGSVEARNLLPKARKEEEIALIKFESACDALSRSRKDLCGRLSTAVSERLPSLGILSKFEARLNVSVQRCTDAAAYGEGSGLGIDSVDFILGHQSSEENRDGRSGMLENIGSAGEKARILLAIETEFPGSVGTLCGRGVSIDDFQGMEDAEGDYVASSVAVIYDEIDAHVGGRAAVALAKLLIDQTRPNDIERGSSRNGKQVISITHSPSVAAVADRHIVIQKAKSNYLSSDDNKVTRNSSGARNPVFAALVDGELREEELGRMCGGDLARDEAVQFAAALLRDGELQKNDQS